MTPSSTLPSVFPASPAPGRRTTMTASTRGPSTLRHALAESRNIPAIKLAQRVGIKTVIEYVRKFGITSEIQPYLPVALGSAEVTLLEHTAAYSTFPNDGVRLSPHSIRKVTDYDGHIMEQDFRRGARRDQRPHRAGDGRVAAGSGAARHRLCRQQIESSAGGQDGHHQRFHRRMVCGLFAFDHAVACGWASTKRRRLAKQGNRGPGGASDLDGFYEGRHRGQEGRAVSPSHRRRCWRGARARPKALRRKIPTANRTDSILLDFRSGAALEYARRRCTHIAARSTVLQPIYWRPNSNWSRFRTQWNESV